MHRVDDLLRRRVPREELAERGARRAVDDDADVPAVGERRGEEHGLDPVGVAQLGVRREQHGVRADLATRRRLRGGDVGKREPAEQCEACKERLGELGHVRFHDGSLFIGRVRELC
jgi:hypothetical protein